MNLEDDIAEFRYPIDNLQTLENMSAALAKHELTDNSKENENGYVIMAAKLNYLIWPTGPWQVWE